MSQPHVLIVTDDAEFAQVVLKRWQCERFVPSFSVASNEALNGPDAPECDLAVVGHVRQGRYLPVLKALDASARPTISICDVTALGAAREEMPRATFLGEGDGWADSLVTTAVEILRRIEAIARCRRVELAASRLQHEAAMGRYMMESRHSLNNALTSILGNSELLMLDRERIAKELAEQVETIHEQAMKMHEMLYRFSSMENEWRVAEKLSQTETTKVIRASATASKIN